MGRDAAVLQYPEPHDVRSGVGLIRWGAVVRDQRGAVGPVSRGVLDPLRNRLAVAALDHRVGRSEEGALGRVLEAVTEPFGGDSARPVITRDRVGGCSLVPPLGLRRCRKPSGVGQSRYSTQTPG